MHKYKRVNINNTWKDLEEMSILSLLIEHGEANIAIENQWKIARVTPGKGGQFAIDNINELRQYAAEVWVILVEKLHYA